MTYDEFRRHLGKAGLTARRFADLLGLNPNSVTNYAERGVVPRHFAALVVLMGEMAEHQLDFEESLKAHCACAGRTRTKRRAKFAGERQMDLI